MEPFNGRCEMLEQKPGRGVITVGLKRSAHDPSRAADCKEGVHTDNDSAESEGIYLDYIPLSFVLYLLHKKVRSNTSSNI